MQRSEADALRSALESAVASNGLSARLQFLSGGEILDAARSARQRADRNDIDAIIVGGGDGTIRTVAGALAETGVPLGILPFGTLNHFAKDLGIPPDISEAVRVIADGHVVPVDLGEINGRIFINNSSIGIYPFMVLDRERRTREQGLSKWIALALGAWRVLRRFPLRRLSIFAEGRKAPCRSPCIFVGNNEYSLTLRSLGRRQHLDGAALWVYVAKSGSRWSLFWLACRAMMGFLDVGKDLELFKVKSAEIRSRTSRLPVASDGEVEIIHTPLHYRTRPAALRVFAPAPNQA